jgi:hypothetical protein
LTEASEPPAPMESQRLHRDLLTELRRHHFYPDFVSVSVGRSARGGGQFTFMFQSVRPRPSTSAVLWIAQLGALGVLWRIRQCLRCKRWYYARFSHQHFCSQRCQQTHYKSSPEWQQHRRAYMRDYRARYFGKKEQER